MGSAFKNESGLSITPQYITVQFLHHDVNDQPIMLVAHRDLRGGHDERACLYARRSAWFKYANQRAVFGSSKLVALFRMVYNGMDARSYALALRWAGVPFRALRFLDEND